MKTNLIISLILVFSPIQLLFAQVVTEGLQSHYVFNGSTEDKSGHDLHGTGNNLETAIGIENITNTAYLFNGSNSYINCGNDSRNILDKLTISAWIKTFSNNRQLFVSKYNYNDDSGYFLATEDGYAIVGGRDNSGEFWQAVSTTTLINDGEWHHIVGIIDQNNWQIWVDCSLDAELISTTVNPYLDCADPLTIGYWYQGSGEGYHRYFDGIIDEVRIYNRPIDINEMDTLCNIDLLVLKNHDLLISDGFDIYPNPSNNFLNIESFSFDHSKIIGYEIFNNLGLIVDKGTSSVGNQIFISKLVSGQYFLRLYSDTNFKDVIFATSFTKI